MFKFPCLAFFVKKNTHPIVCLSVLKNLTEKGRLKDNFFFFLSEIVFSYGGNFQTWFDSGEGLWHN